MSHECFDFTNFFFSFHPGKEIFRCSICKSNARFARDLPDDKALGENQILISQVVQFHKIFVTIWFPKAASTRSSITPIIFFSILELHNIVYHGEVDSKDPTNRIICPFCKISYAKSQISEHIKSEHYGKKNYMCEQCPKTFRTKSLLEKHIELRHLKSKIYECKECDSLKFQSYTSYQTHR